MTTGECCVHYVHVSTMQKVILSRGRSLQRATKDAESERLVDTPCGKSNSLVGGSGPTKYSILVSRIDFVTNIDRFHVVNDKKLAGIKCSF